MASFPERVLKSMFSFRKKKKRRAIDDATEFATFIGEASEFEGSLRGKDHYFVAGKVIGKSELGGILYLDEGGVWQGNISAEVVIIAGTVEGNITAKDKIELTDSGRVKGNLAAPAIAMAEGAVFDGKVTMKEASVTRYRERRGIKPEETEQKD